MTDTQVTLDDLQRGRTRGACAFLSNTPFSGMVADGAVCLGRCSMKGGQVYDRNCETCTMWEARR